MIICCIGDSLTEGDYGVKDMKCVADVHTKNYPYFLQKLTGAEVRNFGKCGFTASLYLDYYKSGIVNVKDADIIIVMLGTNGGHSLTEETQGNKDYRELISLLQRDSKAKIYLVTAPHISTDSTFTVFGFIPQANTSSEFVRRYAKEHNLPLIDINRNERISDKNEKEYQSNDGLHFVEKGYEALAEEILKGLSL